MYLENENRTPFRLYLLYLYKRQLFYKSGFLTVRTHPLQIYYSRILPVQPCVIILSCIRREIPRYNILVGVCIVQLPMCWRIARFLYFSYFFFLYVPLSCHRISDTNYVGFSFPPVVCSTQSTSTPSRPYAKRTRRTNRIFLVPPLIRCYLDVAPLLNEVVDFNTILYICFFPFLSPFSLPTSTLFRCFPLSHRRPVPSRIGAVVVWSVHLCY